MLRWSISETVGTHAVFDLVTDRLTVLTETSPIESPSIAPNGSIVLCMPLNAVKTAFSVRWRSTAVCDSAFQPRQGSVQEPLGRLRRPETPCRRGGSCDSRRTQVPADDVRLLPSAQ